MFRKIVPVMLALILILSSFAAANAEPVTLKVLMFTTGVNEDQLTKVTDKVNEELLATVGCRIEFITVSPADFFSKINMMLSTGEQIDLFETFLAFTSIQGNGYLLALDDYLQYAPDIPKLLGEDYMKMAVVDGKTYGVPTLKDLTTDYSIMFRTDALEACDIDVNTIQTREDLLAALRKLHQAYPDIPVMYGGNASNTVFKFYGNYTDNCWFDTLNDRLGVLMNPTTDSTVENWYATQEYMDYCKFAYQCAQEGLIAYDSLTFDADLLAAGRCLAMAYGYSAKGEAEAESSVGGIDLTPWRELPAANPLATTQNIWTWCVNAECEYPELAMKVLNQLYISENINNLLAWGIEGEHYVKSDAAKNIIRFPEGVHTGNVTYYQWMKFTFANNFAQYLMEGTDPEQWAKVQADNERADISLALGFNFDSGSVTTEIAACTNVVNEYANALECGVVDPEIMIPEFLAKLDAAGINKIIAEKQAQLDAFLGK